MNMSGTKAMMLLVPTMMTMMTIKIMMPIVTMMMMIQMTSITIINPFMTIGEFTLNL